MKVLTLENILGKEDSEKLKNCYIEFKKELRDCLLKILDAEIDTPNSIYCKLVIIYRLVSFFAIDLLKSHFSADIGAHIDTLREVKGNDA